MKLKNERRQRLIAFLLTTILLLSFLAGIQPVQASSDLEVVCVPWKGDENLPHPTLNGKEITLKGTIRYEGNVSWEWDFGDGSLPAIGTAVATDDYPYPLSVNHAYTGSVGTEYVAVLSVTAGAETDTDTYLVQIMEETRLVEADIAIDQALWWLYRQQNRYTSSGVDFGYWHSAFRVAHTGASVQAFENNLHKPYGDPAKDPYVDVVRRGLNYLIAKMYKVNIPADDGDTDGNGFGIACYDDYSHEMYEIGIAMMAIVSSDTPGRVAPTGSEGIIGRTYQEILQDMCDFCAYAQNGPGTGVWEGGWRYYRNYGGSDGSVTQWPIVGMEPAEVKWGITIADFVKPRLEGWLGHIQNANGGFGYTDNSGWLNIAKTAGTGIPGLMFCGVPDTDDRIQSAINYVDANWATDNFGNGYAMYGVMKAFEEFLDMESTGSHIWWEEYVDYLIPLQNSDGYWNTMSYSYSPQLTTAWMVMILTKVVYDVSPTAVAKANGFDEVEVDKDQNVNFDGSQSREGSYEIVKYQWDWESDGVYDAEGAMVTHSYTEYGTFTVTLQVIDNRDVVTGGEKPAMTDTDTCQIIVHPPPHPPVADANGPYIGWIGVPVTLDGSSSWDPNEPPYGDDEIIDWHWDLDNDGVFDDESGETVEHVWNEPGKYPIGLMVRALEEPYWSGEASRTVVDIGNHDPVADIGGPYETVPCTPVTLDGSGSYDPDEPVGDTIVSWEWDLDNDGEYDDDTGEFVEFHRDTEGVYTVRIKVTDTYGATSTDWTTVIVTETILKPDFLIDEIKPVQVIWNTKIDDNDTIDLVADKSTMVRVLVGKQHYEGLDKTVVVEVELQVPLYEADGIVFPKIYTLFPTIQELENTEWRVDFYVDPPTLMGDSTILGKIDPKNIIEESDETNNENIALITIKQARSLSVIYMRMQRAEYGIAQDTSFTETATKGSEFISATYPICEYKFRYEISPITVTGNSKGPLGWGVNLDCVTMNEIAKLFGFDRAVGIPPFEYINYHNVDWAGKTFTFVSGGAVVLDGFWTTIGHEIGHTYGLDDESIEKHVSGFWVTEERDIQDWSCFMGPRIPPVKTLEGDWICDDCYEYLFKKFRVDKEDPEILVVSGVVYKDGNLELGRWFRVKEGKDDLEELIPGNYLLQLLDEEANIIQETSFNLDFWVTIDHQKYERDSAVFSFAVPYPQDAVTGRILCEETIIADVNLNTKLCEDAVNGLTWYYDCLIQSIRQATIPNGIRNSLIAKLNNASMKVIQAITHINEGNARLGGNMLKSATTITQAFINEVSAQRGRSISERDANAFIYWTQKTILPFQDFLVKTLLF